MGQIRLRTVIDNKRPIKWAAGKLRPETVLDVTCEDKLVRHPALAGRKPNRKLAILSAGVQVDIA